MQLQDALDIIRKRLSTSPDTSYDPNQVQEAWRVINGALEFGKPLVTPTEFLQGLPQTFHKLIGA